MKKFIITRDNGTADRLSAMGLKLASHNNDEYIFVNDDTKIINFSEIDNSKLYFSNIYHI